MKPTLKSDTIMLVMVPQMLQDSPSTIILHHWILQQEPATAGSAFAVGFKLDRLMLQDGTILQQARSGEVLRH
jgi:hypothetical protein